MEVLCPISCNLDSKNPEINVKTSLVLNPQLVTSKFDLDISVERALIDVDSRRPDEREDFAATVVFMAELQFSPDHIRSVEVSSSQLLTTVERINKMNQEFVDFAKKTFLNCPLVYIDPNGMDEFERIVIYNSKGQIIAHADKLIREGYYMSGGIFYLNETKIPELSNGFNYYSKTKKITVHTMAILQRL